MLPPCWSRILAEVSFAKVPRSKVPGPAECAKRLNTARPLRGLAVLGCDPIGLISLISLLKETERGLAHSAGPAAACQYAGLIPPCGGPIGPQMAPKWPLNALRCRLVTSYAFSNALQRNFAHILFNFPCCWDVKNHVFIREGHHF